MTAQPERTLALSDMTPDSSTPGRFRWDLGRVVPGRYLVMTFALPLQWVIDTSATGTDRAEIVVPDPIDVSVRVLDETTGAEVEEADVSWCGERTSVSMGGSSEIAKWNAAKRCYEFRGVAGHVELAIHSRDYEVAGETAFDVQPSSRELVMHVTRTCGVVIHLKQGAAVIPWDESTRFHLSLVTRDGKEVSAGCGGTDDQGQYLGTSEPGSYRILVPDQPGFAPVRRDPRSTRLRADRALRDRDSQGHARAPRRGAAAEAVSEPCDRA